MGRKSEGQKVDHQKVLEQWTERDLTAAAEADELLPAFEVDEALQQVIDVITSGRHPVLIGDPGVGKTALVHELVRRSVAGNGPPALEGKRVLQFSFRHRASGLKEPSMVRPEMQKLIEALEELGQDIVPFFRDFQLAYSYDVEPQLQSLAFRHRTPILGEGERAATLGMFEYSPELDQYYVLLNIEEPPLSQASRILTSWATEQERRTRKRFAPEALEEVLHLSHRFLARSHLPRKAVELLGQVASLTEAGETVTPASVIDRFCRSHRVPRSLVDPAIPLDLIEIEARYSDRVLGQAEAVKGVVQMIGLIKAGLSDVRRPFGVFLFVGPTGVGKTHLAQLLAEYLFGSTDRMLRFNMADYPKETDPAILFGDPYASTLPHRRGTLTQRISGHPFAVLLLDEFEKAHEKVHDRFLQLFDEGAFINGAGETVSCRSMILIATSNAGAEVYRGQSLGFTAVTDLASLTKELDRRLAQHFRFEFLNRFDQIVHFRPLTREHIRTIALRELEALKERAGLKRRGILLEVDDPVLDWLTAHGYDPHYGARFLRRTIERHVTTALAEVLVSAKATPGVKILLTVQRNRIVAQLVERPVAPAGRKEVVTLPVGTTQEVRSLDRGRLLAAAEELLKSAERRLVDLEQKKTAASEMLAKMNEAGFWEKSAEARELLEAYRELDVAIQMGSRLAEPVQRLILVRDEVLSGQATLNHLARGLEAAAGALRKWDERLAEEGAGAVWMVLGKIDPLLPATQWLLDLTEMELAWCRKLGLVATVVAYELLDNELSRVVLEVEGPGAEANLTMEEGIHRLYRAQGSDLRARVEVLPRSTPPMIQWPNLATIRRRKGLFELEISCSGRLELPQRGLVMEFFAGDQEVLAHLLSDLRRIWQGVVAVPEVARLYGQDGSGARDPRTGVIVYRLKDVLKGDLDRFLEGWRQSARAREGVTT